MKLKLLASLFLLFTIPLSMNSDDVKILTWGDQGDGTYKNPILKADYSDPDILHVACQKSLRAMVENRDG